MCGGVALENCSLAAAVAVVAVALAVCVCVCVMRVFFILFLQGFVNIVDLFVVICNTWRARLSKFMLFAMVGECVFHLCCYLQYLVNVVLKVVCICDGLNACVLNSLEIRCKNCRKRYFLRFWGPSKIDVSIGIRNETNDFEGVPKHQKSML